MFLKFDEEDSFVPAIIFFFLFFWLGGIICSLIFTAFFSEYKNQPFFIVWLLCYGLIISPIFTFITALFYRIRLNKFAITFMPEAFAFGALVMAYYACEGLNIFHLKDIIKQYEINDSIGFYLIPIGFICIFLALQGLYIRHKRQRNGKLYSGKE